MVEKTAKVNQYGIPSSLATTDKKTYQRLCNRCKSQGIRYEEARAQEGVMKRGKRPAKQVSPKTVPEKKPRKSPVKKERLPFHQTTAGGSASSDTNSPTITSGTPARSPQEKIVQNLILAKNGPLHAGQKVRHNGSKASPFFGQMGEVQKLSADGQCYIKFGESLTWLSPYSVVVVPEAGA